MTAEARKKLEKLAYSSVKEDWDKYYGKSDVWPAEYNFKHVYSSFMYGAKEGFAMGVEAERKRLYQVIAAALPAKTKIDKAYLASLLMIDALEDK